METRVTYYFLGIPIWSVTRKTVATDEDAMYSRLTERFAAEMSESLQRAREAR